VAGDTGPAPLNASEAVEMDTPAARATSVIVARRVAPVGGDASAMAVILAAELDDSGRDGSDCNRIDSI
jgi:hypothetical protein